MESFIIGLLASLAIGFAKTWRHWSKVEGIAHAIVADPSNPITDPRKALEHAVIMLNQQRLEKAVPELERRVADMPRLEAEARARGRKLTEGADFTIVPRDGTEEFKSPWKDGGK